LTVEEINAMAKLYALLVGIDAYDFKPLHGCLNDVAAMREFLTGRFPEERLELKVLLNEQATRQGIIKTFREHLGQAKSGDTALFFYAGHGSRELAPPEYRHLEPDGWDDTLIAYDSRLKDRQEWDLADKELRVLIAEVASRDPHVVVILDSCHSGSATRDSEELVVRRAEPAGNGTRPASTFWFFKPEAELPPELVGAGKWRILPSGRHVLLAACEDHQSAGECADPANQSRGRFSYHLVEAMKEMNGDVRYRDLFKQVQTLVCNHASNQVPQAYGELDAVLFDGNMPVRPPVFYLRKFKDRGWRLDAGKVHAVKEHTVLDVFHEGSVTEGKTGPRLAKVEVTRVDAVESAVKVVEGALPDDAVALPVIVSHLEFPNLAVALKSNSLPQDLRHKIDHSPYLKLEEIAQAEVVIEAGPKGLRLRHKDSARDLFFPDPSRARGVQWVVDALEKIARWKAVSGLANNGDSLASQVQMSVRKWLGSPATAGGDPRTEPFSEEDGAIRLHYDNEGEPGRLTVCIENHSGKPAYFALFGLSEAFAIKMIEDASGRLPDGGKIWVRESDGIPASVPDALYDQGVTQRRDILLLLVSDQEAGFERIQQEGVYEEGRSWRGESPDLQDLLVWRKYRELGGEAPKGRWAAQTQAIVAVRPPKKLEMVLKSDSKRDRVYRDDRELDAGVRLVTPDRFQGSARLLSASEAAERLGVFLDPPPLTNAKTYPLALAGGWGSDGGLSVLELKGGYVSTVTANDPLKIFATPDLPDDEIPVVLAFDGRQHQRVEISGIAGFPLVIPHLPLPQRGDTLWLLFRSAKNTGDLGEST
jgi:hypothetical protein